MDRRNCSRSQAITSRYWLSAAARAHPPSSKWAKSGPLSPNAPNTISRAPSSLASGGWLLAATRASSRAMGRARSSTPGAGAAAAAGTAPAGRSGPGDGAGGA